MSQGPSLLFDKSTLESLSVNEAVLLDDVYRSTITPLFFVECLADLEREVFYMKGTPKVVGSIETVFLIESSPEGIRASAIDAVLRAGGQERPALQNEFPEKSSVVHFHCVNVPLECCGLFGDAFATFTI